MARPLKELTLRIPAGCRHDKHRQPKASVLATPNSAAAGDRTRGKTSSSSAISTVFPEAGVARPIARDELARVSEPTSNSEMA